MSDRREPTGSPRRVLDLRALVRSVIFPTAALLLAGGPLAAFAQLPPGEVLVVDEHAGPGLLGMLFRVNPVTGNRALLSDFGNAAQGPLGIDPFGVAVEASGAILAIDFGALGPAVGKANVTAGMLFRADPVTGYRNLLSDFAAVAQGPLGTDPMGVAVEASGAILVTDAEAGRGGMGALFRVDPLLGKRTLFSDFGDAAQGPLGLSPLGVAVVPSARQAVAGCVDVGGNPLSGAGVRLTQPRETAQTATTDADGCYQFGRAVSGRKGKVRIILPMFP